MGAGTETLPPTEATPTPRPASRGRRALTLIGVLLVVTGLSFLGVYVWDAYFNPVMDTKAAQQQVEVVKKEWAQGRTPSSKIPGNAVALLRVPDFGPDFEVPVVTGTTPYALSVGVGWFEGSAAPGQVGNFALAGHRGASGPFVPLLDLKPGARIVVETRKATFVYALTSSAADLTVDKTETWVVDPVPERPGRQQRTHVAPTKRLITLITCRNFFHSPERSVAFGELLETIRK
ncbi:MAG: sortase [Micropruina sp.]|uniref:sortase domain-containing protein n=1 Tax=Micropruina sp. TaxID=2737536 RepID=UPI0039E3828C